MKKRIAGILAVIAIIAAAAEASAYTLYSQNSAAKIAAQSITEELADINAQIAAAEKSYSPNADIKYLAEQEAKQNEPAPAESEQAESAPTEPAPAESEPTESALTESAPVEESEHIAEESPLGFDMKEFAGLYEKRLELSQQLMDDTAAQTNELIKMLMEYDISLKKLTLSNERYNRLKANAEKLYAEFRTGGCAYSDYEALEKETEKMYYNIKEQIFGIGVLKGEIEALTGETLTDSFDFDSIYLITDALALENGKLADMSQLSSIADPVLTEEKEAEEQEAPDYSGEINSAVKAYYKLGTALRTYIEACEAYKIGCSDLKLERITAEQLLELQTTKEDEYLNVCAAKAEYTSALLDLDAAAGTALTYRYGMSGGLIGECRKVCDEESKGKGLWKVIECDGKRYFSVASYPMLLDEYEDDYYGYYTVEYNGKQIGKANIGASCRLSAVKYKDGKNTARVTFYEANGRVYSYTVSVFAPFGGFVTTK
ncbi:MAG: hypothetical protein ACI4KM_07175 [Oscillospiraceae bacterium]